MSYDLMVFETANAPKNKKDFMQWYAQQTEWGEDHDHASIEVASPALQNWFMEMKETFPPMNGPFAPDDAMLMADSSLEERLTDYCIGHEVIYMAFAWSLAEEAYELTRDLAQKYGVGFFDVSSEEGDIILPESVDRQESTRSLWSKWKQRRK